MAKINICKENLKEYITDYYDKLTQWFDVSVDSTECYDFIYNFEWKSSKSKDIIVKNAKNYIGYQGINTQYLTLETIQQIIIAFSQFLFQQGIFIDSGILERNHMIKYWKSLDEKLTTDNLACVWVNFFPRGNPAQEQFVAGVVGQTTTKTDHDFCILDRVDNMENASEDIEWPKQLSDIDFSANYVLYFVISSEDIKIYEDVLSIILLIIHRIYIIDLACGFK